MQKLLLSVLMSLWFGSCASSVSAYEGAVCPIDQGLGGKVLSVCHIMLEGRTDENGAGGLINYRSFPAIESIALVRTGPSSCTDGDFIIYASFDGVRWITIHTFDLTSAVAKLHILIDFSTYPYPLWRADSSSMDCADEQGLHIYAELR